MKTKTLLIMCLFLGIGLTQLSAQNGKNGTGSVSYNYFVDFLSTLQIYCDGVVVDELTAINFNSKTVDHYSNNIWLWEFARINNISYTSRSGEKFTVTSHQKFDLTTSPITYSFFANFRGNRGNNYTLQMTGDFDGNIFEIRSNCH